MIQPLIQWLTSHGKQALGENDKGNLFKAFMELESRLVAAERSLSSFLGGSSSSSSNFAVKHIFLNANYAVPVPAEPVNTVLLYVWTHDATANNYTVTWPSPPFSRMAQPFQGEDVVTFQWAFKRSTSLIQPAAGVFGGFPI